MKQELAFVKIQTFNDLLNSMKDIERQIRSSSEYKTFLYYIKEINQIRNCAFFKDIDFVDKKMTIEFHHHPFTLYDIVLIIGTSMIADLKDDEYLLTFDISKRVIEEHLDDTIPGIMLSKTIHEMYHNGLYEIPTDSPQMNLGDYTKFVGKYGEFLQEKDIENLQKYIQNPEEKDSIYSLWATVSH